ncbi:TetR/AcrR family transcriptional regulator [Pandoraea nosoerga]|uniref:TetR family transcriptional regulator n=1 Tax=Pandoraea nosoerga TaxID=2508296 RepID=A0A5E4WWW6_9BURK|nr:MULTISPECIES: TetR/AcrR family transcriptional regulator [Pandoraea]MBN4668062.1 TetR/AcrR family transcriptional regulator [Pandoraea nosoerga]MBN4676436.1 TetR/AcrR family transcriptional regulator [Pandoraea nosoerga]MBN4681474.1 TetR/AcrR family transcriptional regulator [Pandoraea nosoerga]MBN4747060.1 TetR/AcrR family transcriptional regulator [Pandoraea nosoerga]VVE29327.1 TetR family transcriptional regulator [Pandoraea nosoerga]
MSIELSPRALEIVQHTRQLLAAGGYHGFSYADLSERVHIGKASIHHHFPGKADLVLTVVRMHRAQTLEGLAALDTRVEDPLARLSAYTDYWAECIRDATLPICICAVLAAELPLIPPEIASEVRRYFDDLGTWIATVLAEGAARMRLTLYGDARTQAQTFMSTVYGAMLTARASGNAESFQAVSRMAIERFRKSN